MGNTHPGTERPPSGHSNSGRQRKPSDLRKPTSSHSKRNKSPSRVRRGSSPHNQVGGTQPQTSQQGQGNATVPAPAALKSNRSRSEQDSAARRTPPIGPTATSKTSRSPREVGSSSEGGGSNAPTAVARAGSIRRRGPKSDATMDGSGGRGGGTTANQSASNQQQEASVNGVHNPSASSALPIGLDASVSHPAPLDALVLSDSGYNASSGLAGSPLAGTTSSSIAGASRGVGRGLGTSGRKRKGMGMGSFLSGCFSSKSVTKGVVEGSRGRSESNRVGMSSVGGRSVGPTHAEDAFSPASSPVGLNKREHSSPLPEGADGSKGGAAFTDAAPSEKKEAADNNITSNSANVPPTPVMPPADVKLPPGGLGLGNGFPNFRNGPANPNLATANSNNDQRGMTDSSLLRSLHSLEHSAPGTLPTAMPTHRRGAASGGATTTAATSSSPAHLDGSGSPSHEHASLQMSATSGATTQAAGANGTLGAGVLPTYQIPTAAAPHPSIGNPMVLSGSATNARPAEADPTAPTARATNNVAAANDNEEEEEDGDERRGGRPKLRSGWASIEKVNKNSANDNTAAANNSGSSPVAPLKTAAVATAASAAPSPTASDGAAANRVASQVAGTPPLAPWRRNDSTAMGASVATANSSTHGTETAAIGAVLGAVAAGRPDASLSRGTEVSFRLPNGEMVTVVVTDVKQGPATSSVADSNTTSSTQAPHTTNTANTTHVDPPPMVPASSHNAPPHPNAMFGGGQTLVTSASASSSAKQQLGQYPALRRSAASAATVSGGNRSTEETTLVDSPNSSTQPMGTPQTQFHLSTPATGPVPNNGDGMGEGRAVLGAQHIPRVHPALGKDAAAAMGPNLQTSGAAPDLIAAGGSEISPQQAAPPPTPAGTVDQLPMFSHPPGMTPTVAEPGPAIAAPAPTITSKLHARSGMSAPLRIDTSEASLRPNVVEMTTSPALSLATPRSAMGGTPQAMTPTTAANLAVLGMHHFSANNAGAVPDGGPSNTLLAGMVVETPPIVTPRSPATGLPRQPNFPTQQQQQMQPQQQVLQQQYRDPSRGLDMPCFTTVGMNGPALFNPNMIAGNAGIGVPQLMRGAGGYPGGPTMGGNFQQQQQQQQQLGAYGSPTGADEYVPSYRHAYGHADSLTLSRSASQRSISAGTHQHFLPFMGAGGPSSPPTGQGKHAVANAAIANFAATNFLGGLTNDPLQNSHSSVLSYDASLRSSAFRGSQRQAASPLGHQQGPPYAPRLGGLDDPNGYGLARSIPMADLGAVGSPHRHRGGHPIVRHTTMDGGPIKAMANFTAGPAQYDPQQPIRAAMDDALPLKLTPACLMSGDDSMVSSESARQLASTGSANGLLGPTNRFTELPKLAGKNVAKNLAPPAARNPHMIVGGGPQGIALNAQGAVMGNPNPYGPQLAQWGTPMAGGGVAMPGGMTMFPVLSNAMPGGQPQVVVGPNGVLMQAVGVAVPPHLMPMAQQQSKSGGIDLSVLGQHLARAQQQQQQMVGSVLQGGAAAMCQQQHVDAASQRSSLTRRGLGAAPMMPYAPHNHNTSSASVNSPAFPPAPPSFANNSMGAMYALESPTGVQHGINPAALMAMGVPPAAASSSVGTGAAIVSTNTGNPAVPYNPPSQPQQSSNPPPLVPIKGSAMAIGNSLSNASNSVQGAVVVGGDPTAAGGVNMMGSMRQAGPPPSTQPNGLASAAVPGNGPPTTVGGGNNPFRVWSGVSGKPAEGATSPGTTPNGVSAANLVDASAQPNSFALNDDMDTMSGSSSRAASIVAYERTQPKNVPLGPSGRPLKGGGLPSSLSTRFPGSAQGTRVGTTNQRPAGGGSELMAFGGGPPTGNAKEEPAEQLSFNSDDLEGESPSAKSTSVHAHPTPTAARGQSPSAKPHTSQTNLITSHSNYKSSPSLTPRGQQGPSALGASSSRKELLNSAAFGVPASSSSGGGGGAAVRSKGAIPSATAPNIPMQPPVFSLQQHVGGGGGLISPRERDHNASTSSTRVVSGMAYFANISETSRAMKQQQQQSVGPTGSSEDQGTAGPTGTNSTVTNAANTNVNSTVGGAPPSMVYPPMLSVSAALTEANLMMHQPTRAMGSNSSSGTASTASSASRRVYPTAPRPFLGGAFKRDDDDEEEEARL